MRTEKVPAKGKSTKRNILFQRKKKMAKAAKKEVQLKETAKAKTFIKSIALPGLPIARVGDEVTGDYIAAIAKLSKEDQSKYVG